MGYPIDYREPFNPRFRLSGDHFKRTWKALELAEDLEEGKARNALMLLTDCFPAGSPSDAEGADSRIVNNVIALVEMHDPDIEHFMRIAFESGGLSVTQVDHIIAALETNSEKSKRSI